MNPISKVFVKYHGKRVGELTQTSEGNCCVFRYDGDWLTTGFSISPFGLPLKAETFVAPLQTHGRFGIFEDSLPDGYGRYVLGGILRQQGVDVFSLTTLQQLSILGDAGMGALCYEPETCSALSAELDRLRKMASDVLSERDEIDVASFYTDYGKWGGCRPKCFYRDDEGDWLVKFPHPLDPANFESRELRYNEIARDCGLELPDFKLMKGTCFATRRFDRSNGERLHVATAEALLNEVVDATTLDYKTLLRLTEFMTQDPKQVEAMFRIMVFNVLVDNKDDHANNFSFIFHDGRWRLAPAYDLTPSLEGTRDEHAVLVNNNGKPTMSDMLAVGEDSRIPKQRGMEIIDFVREKCQEILSKDYR